MFILVSDSVPDFPSGVTGVSETHSPVPGPWTSCGRTFLTHCPFPGTSSEGRIMTWCLMTSIDILHTLHTSMICGSHHDSSVAYCCHRLSHAFTQHQKSSNGQLRKGVLDFLTFLRSSLRRETQALQPGFADRICEMKFFKHWRPCK